LLKKINQIIEDSAATLKQHRHRLAVVFHIEHASCDADLDQFINELAYSKKLVLSSRLENALPYEKARMCLGEEYDLVVFDARQLFSLDALGIVSGVLCGGGVLLIILPDENAWNSNMGHYTRYASQMFSQSPAVIYLAHESKVDANLLHGLASLEIDDTARENNVVEYEQRGYKTQDQQSAVNEMFRLINDERDSCVVLSSGRGRGKSASLGLLVAKLLQHKRIKVLITAPRLSVTDTAFYHLEKCCPSGVATRGRFNFKDSAFEFYAPDILLETLPDADVLLIDEAAVIPVPMLEKLLKRYSHIVFSTTTHGYEGTGRGFILKFYGLLDRTRPEWREFKLHQPVRWARNDPLEKWIEQLLFLDLQLDNEPRAPENMAQCQVELINQVELVDNKAKREAIFSLLVTAHYRTSPADFQYIFDSQDIRVYTLEYQEKVLAVLLINQEGGFDAELSTDIYHGRRRPKGHLLAQTLCFHAGYEQAASYCYSRVMRIAVHPQLQHSGYGSYLLSQVIENEKNYDIDILGTSFSATPELIRFWEKASMSLLRIGFSRDHVSASNSAVMATALSERGKKLVAELSARFERNLPEWLDGALANINDELKQYLAQSRNKTEKSFYSGVNAVDMQDIKSFAEYQRNYDACFPSISRWLNSFEQWPDFLTVDEKEIIGASLKYKNNLSALAQAVNCRGKNEALAMLRSALNHLLNN